MDYKVVSQQVVDNVGGLENIEGATHCVTRLRLVLKDTSKYNKAELENIDGVKGVLYNSGQLMIIFGTGTVNKVYDEFMALTGVKEISASEVKGAEADKKGKFFSVLKVFSDIFIPIIPAFVGAAIIIGLKSLIVANGLFGMEGSLADHSEFLKNLASFFAIIATTFDYLPVLVMVAVFEVCGEKVSIEDEQLARALKAIEERKRNIVLQYFFIGDTDTYIGKMLDCSRANVTKCRIQALDKLKQLIEEEKEKCQKS